MELNLLQLILTDHTLQTVSLGSAFLGIISGILGSFAVVRKQSLIGDAVSHAALPGIAAAFLLTQTKSTGVLLLGALASGLLSTLIIMLITGYTRVKFDSALALVLSVFFGGGMVLLTYIQKIPNANQAGLENFIFGQASTLLRSDLWLMAGLGGVLILFTALFWKEFKLVSFDPEFAESIGFPVRRITVLLSAMIVVAIIIGLQTVGVILMSAMLIAPAVAARQWTNKLSGMVLLAAVFGAAAGFAGTVLSSVAVKLPTGPVIVIVVSSIVLVSLTVAPGRGLLSRYWQARKQRQNITEDLILRNLYYLAMNHEDVAHSHSLAAIMPHRDLRGRLSRELVKGLDALAVKGLVSRQYFNEWSITAQGIAQVQAALQKEGQ